MNLRLGAVIACAAAIRAAYLLWYRAHDPLHSYLLHDALQYDRWARALAAGEPLHAGAFYQAPGYPYLLATIYRAVGAEPFAIYVVQLLAGLVTIALIHRIATRAYDERAGLVAAVLAALYGAYPFHETKLLSAAFAVLLTCLIVERVQAADAGDSEAGWALAGAVLGLACIVRPNLMLLVPIVVAWIVRRVPGSAAPRRLRAALLFVVGCTAFVLPVMLRNVTVGGELVPVSTNGGVVFWAGNNPAARGWIATPGMSGSIATQRDEARSIAEAERGRALSGAEVSRFWLQRGLAFVTTQPARWVTLELRKAWLALDDHEHGLEYDAQLDANPVRFAMPITFAVILALAVARLAARRPFARAEAPIALALAAHGATLLLFYAASRFRLPATGPLLAVAGGGAVMLWDTWRGGSRRRASMILLAALAAAALSYAELPASGAQTYRARSASSVCDLALAHQRTGRVERAIELYREAIERDPGYALAHLDLGNLLRETGRVEQAERALVDAVRLAPELAEAHVDLGSLFLETERAGLAAASFARAYRLNPASSDTGSRLIGCYLTLERERDAIRVWREMRSRGVRAHPSLERWMARHGQR